MPKKHRKPFKPLPLVVALVIVIVGLGIYVAFIRPNPNRQPVPKATISQLPAQSSSSNSEKDVTSSDSKNQGTASDNNGVSMQATPPSSQWAVSNSGNLTVKAPTQGTQVSNNFELSGSSTVPKVQYRLLDNQTGVISQGFINVVGGNFSANVSFKATSNSGRLDVFSIDSSGVEINEVQLQVKF